MNIRDGTAKTFSHRIAFALLIKTHRIAPHLHRIRISHSTFRISFLHFRTFFTFLVIVSQLMHEKVAKNAK
jgi:hypothetical protein